MGIFKFLKKEKEIGEDLEIPPAPPIKEALPTFAEKEVKVIKEAVEKPRPPPKPKVRVAPPPKERIVGVEEAAVIAQRRLLAERERLELTKPIFIDVGIFRDVIDEIALIQNTLKETSDSLSRLDEFREDENKEFRRWQSDMQDVQKKLIYVDKTLFG